VFDHLSFFSEVPHRSYLENGLMLLCLFFTRVLGFVFFESFLFCVLLCLSQIILKTQWVPRNFIFRTFDFFFRTTVPSQRRYAFSLLFGPP